MQHKHNSARERLKAAFLADLINYAPSKENRAAVGRIGDMADAHFSEFCSFYSPRTPGDTKPELCAFLADGLLHPLDCARISVSSLTAETGVNRATFYKSYPNLALLYDECCRDLTGGFTDIALPEEKTEETMLAYGEQLWALQKKNKALLFALTHRTGRRDLIYTIGCRLRDKMENSLTPEERASQRVRENLSVFPALFSARFGLTYVGDLCPGMFPDRGLPAYEPMRSFAENTAAAFRRRFGGDPQVFLALELAAIKLLREKHFSEISVSELCRTAGYPRSTFYNRFSDALDYKARMLENTALTFVSAVLYFWDDPGKLTGEAMRTFRSELAGFGTEGVRAILLNGGTTYILSATYTYLTRILSDRSAKAGSAPDTALSALISYDVCCAMRALTLCCLGVMTDADLRAESTRLMRLKLATGLE